MPRRPEAKAETRELSVIQRTYDLVLWYVPRLGKLPREHRFGLGQEIVQGLYGLLSDLVTARYLRSKAARLEAANARLQVLRYQTRMLRDLGLLDLRRYEYVVERLVPIGKELGGWLRAAAGSRP